MGGEWEKDMPENIAPVYSYMVIVTVTCYSMQAEGPGEAWGKQGCLKTGELKRRSSPPFLHRTQGQGYGATMSDGGRLGNKGVLGQYWQKASETELEKTERELDKMSLSNGLQVANFN